MSDVQKEASTCFSMAHKYSAIKQVFDKMPDRFKLLELMNAAGIKDSPRTRGAVSTVLYRDYKCINVGSGYNRCWKKP